MNLLDVIIPEPAIVVSIVLGVLIAAAAAVIVLLLIKKKKVSADKKVEPKKEKLPHHELDNVERDKVRGKLEKTYAPLFSDEFRGDYQADYKSKADKIDTSSDIYIVPEEKLKKVLSEEQLKRKERKVAAAKDGLKLDEEKAVRSGILATQSDKIDDKTQDKSTADTQEKPDKKSTKKSKNEAILSDEKQTILSKESGELLDNSDNATTDKSMAASDGETAVVVRGGSLFKVNFLKSFEARLIQADADDKRYYSDIKNELLSYGLKCRRSWKGETFHLGRKKVAALSMRGKNLCLLLDLNPADYEGSHYKVEDMSDTESLKATPLLYRIKNPRRAKYAPDLIADAMKKASIEKVEYTPSDFADIPYASNDELIERKLIKVVEQAQPEPDEKQLNDKHTEPAKEEVVEEAIKEAAVEDEALAELQEEAIKAEAVEEPAIEEPVIEESIEEPTPEPIPEPTPEPAKEAAVEEAIKEAAVEEPIPEPIPEPTPEPTDEPIQEEAKPKVKRAREVIHKEVASKIVEEVTQHEASQALSDEDAEALIEEGEVSDRKKFDIVNIDTLAKVFKKGETVTLEQVKKRIPSFNKKATALKVLARGVLNKPLTVEADDFSIEAVKMIILTGGKVIKKRRDR